jgi:hypothetical protein
MKNLLIALLAVVLVTGIARAQSSEAIAITASVGVELVVAAAADLEFGEVAPGVTYTINTTGLKVPGGPGEGGANEELAPGQWDIEGQGNANVAVTFLLSDRLIGDGGGAIAVSYTSQSAGWNNAQDPSATQLLFDPRVGTTLQLSDDGLASVFLGAVISVPLGAPAGEYVGSAALNASYTGF